MNLDLICIGMALVDSIIRGFNPEAVSASGFVAESGTLNAGGEAVNAAVAAAKLGLHTGIFCALGNDPAGEIVLDELRRNGVDTRPVVRTGTTPVTTMFVRENSTRKSITNKAHRFNFHPERTPVFFTDARAILLGSLFRAPFDDPAGVFALVNAAQAAGQLVLADTKIPNFRALVLADLRDSLPQIDYITPNEDEARHFTGKEDPEAMADVFLDYGVRNVIIKLGGKGCLLKNGKTTIRLPALPVDAVDATGAGDNFGAGFISEILRGAPPEAALRFANACGAVCTTAVGAGTALRDREQVIRLLDGSPAKKK